MQFSYVVDDLDRAAQHWASLLQVGPFFALKHVPYRVCEYRGQPTPVDMSVAIAYSGDIQIELVQQHNDAPSIFQDFLRTRGPGLQHVAIVTENLAEALQAFAQKNVVPIQRGEAENGTLFAYLDTAMIPGTMLELVELPDSVARAFEYMREKSAQWSPGQDALIC